jgi:excisionase family DNA binding protein
MKTEADKLQQKSFSLSADSDKLAEIISNKVIEKLSLFLDVSSQNAYPLHERWLDIYETCQLLKISKRTLQSYRDNGIIPYSKFGGKIYFKASDIQKYLEDHYIPAFRK